MILYLIRRLAQDVLTNGLLQSLKFVAWAACEHTRWLLASSVSLESTRFYLSSVCFVLSMRMHRYVESSGRQFGWGVDRSKMRTPCRESLLLFFGVSGVLYYETWIEVWYFDRVLFSLRFIMHFCALYCAIMPRHSYGVKSHGFFLFRED